MEVRVSGAVLSSLFLQVAASKGDVEGFLVGEICSRTVKAVTDSHSQDVKHERVASIQGFVPCHSVFRCSDEKKESMLEQFKQNIFFPKRTVLRRHRESPSFYDTVGRIQETKLTQLLCKKEKEVIGWYKFRRNSPTQVSMREKVVHHNLMHALEFSQTKEFLFAVFSACLTPTMSTHTFVYSVQCWSDNSVFEQVPVNVINLGDTSHSEYRLASRNAPVKSRTYQSVIDSYRQDFIDDDRCIQQVTGIHSMYITTLKKLQELAEEVKGSEHEVSELRSKVTTFESRLRRKREEIRQAAACQGDSAPTASSTTEDNQRNEFSNMEIEENASNKPVKTNNASYALRGDEKAEVDGKRYNGNCGIISEEPMEAEQEETFIDRQVNKIPNKLQVKTSFRSRRKQETPKRTESVRRISRGETGSDDDETQDYPIPEEMDHEVTSQALSQTF